MEGCAAVGQSPKGSTLERMAQSKNYQNGKFVNTLEPEDIPFWSTLRDYFKGQKHAVPKTPPPVVEPETVTVPIVSTALALLTLVLLLLFVAIDFRERLVIQPRPLRFP